MSEVRTPDALPAGLASKAHSKIINRPSVIKTNPFDGYGPAPSGIDSDLYKIKFTPEQSKAAVEALKLRKKEDTERLKQLRQDSIDSLRKSLYSYNMNDGTPPVEGPKPSIDQAGGLGSPNPSPSESPTFGPPILTSEDRSVSGDNASSSGDDQPKAEKISFRDAIKRNIELGLENQKGARETVKKNTEGVRKLFNKSIEIGKKVKDKTAEIAVLTKKGIIKGKEVTAPIRADLVDSAKLGLALGNSLMFESEGRTEIMKASKDAINDAQEKIALKSEQIKTAISDAKDSAVNNTREAVLGIKNGVTEKFIPGVIETTKFFVKDAGPRAGKWLAHQAKEKSVAGGKYVGGKVVEGATTAGTAAKAVAYDAPKAAISEVNQVANAKLTEANFAVSDLDAEVNYRLADWTHRLTFNAMKQGVAFSNGIQARGADFHSAWYSNSAVRAREFQAFMADRKSSIANAKWQVAERHDRLNKDRLENKSLKKTEKTLEAMFVAEMARQNAQEMQDRATDLRLRAAAVRGFVTPRWSRSEEGDEADTAPPTIPVSDINMETPGGNSTGGNV